jgi:hypothetical protein
MNTVETLPAGSFVRASHPRLHGESVGTLTEDFRVTDTYVHLIFADSQPYSRPLILTHRNHLLEVLPTPDRAYSSDRPAVAIPTTTAKPTTTKRSRTRKTK